MKTLAAALIIASLSSCGSSPSGDSQESAGGAILLEVGPFKAYQEVWVERLKESLRPQTHHESQEPSPSTLRHRRGK